MTADTASAAAIALNRFGLGARPGEALPADPRHWLIAQMAGFDPRPPVIANTPASPEMAAEFRRYLVERRLIKQQGMPLPPAPVRPLPPGAMTDAQMEAATRDNPKLAGLPKDLQRDIRRMYRDSYSVQATARLSAAMITPAPFAERLAHFWANHFAISTDKLEMIGLGGTLEFEAIRPHLFGKFSEMVLAVETHPAMLLYLDQAQSIGPDSFIGQRAALRRNPNAKKVGLNENLAREIMELHTLGVNGGYTQGDVQELARALTGWSVGGFVRGPIGKEAGDGAFVFQDSWHEPGTRTLLGRRYGDQGFGQGRAILADLAVHPATAHHLATKLARHFVADAPSPALVARLAKAHVDSGGDLRAVYTALIDAPEAWAVAEPKFKSPWEWSVSLLRGVGVRELPDQKMVGVLTELGQPTWRPGSPAGWDDTAAAWAGPDALLRRVEVAQRLAALVGDRLDARVLAPQLLPGTLTPATASAIARAGSPQDALALLFVSPEFLRR